MRNIKLTIEYDGTDYSGWQIQDRRSSLVARRSKQIKRFNDKKTIQDTIEQALAQILQEKVKLIGSGRTDAGVHAHGQVANFKTKTKLNCGNIQKGLNTNLPCDIRIKQVEDTNPKFHACFSTQSKLYRYTIVNDSYVPPHLYRYCYLVRYPLDIKKMRRACACLLGRHNFRSFQAVDKRKGSSIRTVKCLDIQKKGKFIYLDIEAKGFLYRMVRNIVGTLIEVGRGKLKPPEINRILKAKNRVLAGPCAPAKGLCLIEVKYK